MFASPTTSSRSKRSLRELMWDAVDTALEFATLGEAHLPDRPRPSVPPTPSGEHPHRRQLGRRPRVRRAGMVPSRAHVCTSPTFSRGTAERH